MNKIAYKLPEGVKVLSHEVIDGQVVVTYEESKKLHLEANENNALCGMYGNECIGFISDKGKCYILSLVEHRVAYHIWVKDGMPVDHSEVEWRGKKYKINNDCFLLSMNHVKGGIFNFKYASYCNDCSDENIQRYPHNLTPIAY